MARMIDADALMEHYKDMQGYERCACNFIDDGGEPSTENKPVMVSIRGDDGATHIKFVSVTEIETLRAMYGDKLIVFG